MSVTDLLLPFVVGVAGGIVLGFAIYVGVIALLERRARRWR